MNRRRCGLLFLVFFFLIFFLAALILVLLLFIFLFIFNLQRVFIVKVVFITEPYLSIIRVTL